jgi:hypothetical protein
MPDLPSIRGGPSAGSAANAANSLGISVPAHASANTKGSWTQLVAATSYETSWVVVTLLEDDGTRRALVDIGVGASTAEQVLIPNLSSEAVASASQLTPRSYVLPVAIPSGTRVSARSQNSTGGGTTYVGINLFADDIASCPAMGRVEAAGVVGATSRLTAVDPGGSANTKGSWVELIAATSFHYRWMCLAFGHGASATTSNQGYHVDIGIGGAGSEVLIVPSFPTYISPNVDSSGVVLCMPVAIPSGTRVVARTQCQNNTANNRVIDVGMWGVG